jgi:AbrB family looped-hinge helix DNA binding protein
MAAKERWEKIVTGHDRRVGSRGEITIPKEYREKFDLDPGDVVGVEETDDGTIEIVPPPE